MNSFHNFNLKEYNGHKVSSTCRTAYFPQSEEQIIDLYKRNPKLQLIGSGHNIILTQQHYDRDFLILNNCFDKISLQTDNTIDVEAGAFMKNVSVFAQENGLSGLEFFYDIPSSLGGAVVMNAGTKEGETSKVITKVRYLDLEDLKIKEICKEKAEFQYRNSIFQNSTKKVVLAASFELIPDNKKDILKRMKDSKARRWSKQPREFPNCGSVFKRPPGKFVGPMIEELGLKGYQIGGAQISKKHSGFIVNIGNATGQDIISLIDFVKQKVMKEFNINLEVEQRIL
tara:strand:+ start:89967 stop:90821 length:855 start_codon:yes stop_codon:yes gene_type:complete